MARKELGLVAKMVMLTGQGKEEEIYLQGEPLSEYYQY